MNRLWYLVLAAVCLIVPANTVWSAPVPGARSGLEQIPESAPLVIHVRGVQGVHGRVVALMKAALPELLDKYKDQIDDFFEKGPDNALKGRKIRGLAKDGPLFFALLELPKVGDSGEPKMAFILTVTDYKEFVENILTEEERKNAKDEGNGIKSASIDNKQFYFVDRKGYAIVTPDKDVAESFNKKITGLHAKMNKDLASKLLSSDLGLYVNMDAVYKEYGEQIKQAKQGIQQAIDFGAAAAEESQKQFVELAKKAVNPIFQAIEDMQSLLLTFELRQGGLALHVQSEVKDDSPTEALLHDSRPIDFEELGRLPRDRAYYLGMKASAGMYKSLSSLMSSFPTGGTKDSGNLMKELAKAGPNVLLSSGSFPSAGLDVSHFDDPAKVVAATLKMYQSMVPADNDLKEKPVVKPDAEKFGDFKLHSVQLSMDLEKMAEKAAANAKADDEAKKQLVKAMKGFVGEKKSIWFGTDGKTFVTVTAPDWNSASKLLEQYSKNADAAHEVKAFSDARKEMPKQTSLLVLLDTVRMFGRILEAVKPMIPSGQVPANWPKMPGKGTSAYLGLSATLQPQRGSFDVFITAAAAREFYKAIIQPLVGGGE